MKLSKRLLFVLVTLLIVISMTPVIAIAAEISTLPEEDGLLFIGTGGDIEEETNEGNGYISDEGLPAPLVVYSYDPQPTTRAEVRDLVDAYEAAYQAALLEGGFPAALEVQKPRWEFEVDESLMPDGWRCDSLTDEDTGAVYWTFFPAPVAAANPETVSSWSQLVAAVADPSVDTIKIANDIALEGVLEIPRNLNFEAAGGSGVTLTARSGSRHMNVTGGNITLTFDGKVTLDGGYTTAGDGNVTRGGISSAATNLTLINAVIQNCNKHVPSTSSQGGGGVFASGNLTLTGCEITGNSTTGGDDYSPACGNGVCVDNGDGSLTVSGGEISGNYYAGDESYIDYSYGGGIYFCGNDVTINGGAKIDGNTAGAGAGLFTNCLHITIGGGASISNNKALFAGGGICAPYGIVTLKSGKISGNWANPDYGAIGGGVYAPDGTVIFEGGEISGNTAYCGGGIFADSVEIYAGALIGGEGKPNIATTGDEGGDPAHGGGVYCYMLYMMGGEISYNQAEHDGGGVYVSISVFGGYGSEVLVGNGGYIQYNMAGQHGGGLYVAKEQSGAPPMRAIPIPTSSNIIIEGGSIDHNEAVAGNGGGIFTNVSIQMTSGVISDNQASAGNGGGVYVHNKYLYYDRYNEISYDIVFQVTNGAIRNNRAQNGGGVYLTEPVEGMEYDWELGYEVSRTFAVGMIAGAEVPGGAACNVYITGNTAIQNGGGIFTEAFGAYDALTADDYQNISLYPFTYFAGNKAAAAYEPPSIANSYTNITYATTSITDTAGSGYLHPINNYDINYVGLTPLPDPTTYTVTYDPNGGSGSMTDANSPYSANATADILANGFTNGDLVFAGFKIQGDVSGAIYAAAADSIAGAANSFAITGHTVLVAQWATAPDPTAYTVTYNANGGTGGTYADSGLSAGSYTIKTLAATGFSRNGYVFLGWNTEPGGNGTSYAAGNTLSLSGSLTLYAQWTQLSPTPVWPTTSIDVLPPVVIPKTGANDKLSFGMLLLVLGAAMALAPYFIGKRKKQSEK